jgi:hypothetical protein
MMKKENVVLGSLYSNSDLPFWRPWAAGCNVSPFLCLILSQENDVILAQVDNRRLWRQQEGNKKKGKRRKETEKDTRRQLAKNKRKGLLTQLQTCHSIVVCLFTLCFHFIFLFFLSRIYFFLSSLRYFDWLRCPSGGKEKEKRQVPRLNFFTLCPQLYI